MGQGERTCSLCNITESEYQNRIFQERANELRSMGEEARNRIAAFRLQIETLTKQELKVQEVLDRLPAFIKNMKISSLKEEMQNLIADFPELNDVIAVISPQKHYETLEQAGRSYLQNQSNKELANAQIVVAEVKLKNLTYKLRLLEELRPNLQRGKFAERSIQLKNYGGFVSPSSMDKFMVHLVESNFHDVDQAIAVGAQIVSTLSEYWQDRKHEHRARDRGQLGSRNLSDLILEKHGIKLPQDRIDDLLRQITSIEKIQVDRENVILNFLEFSSFRIALCPVCNRILSKLDAIP